MRAWFGAAWKYKNECKINGIYIKTGETTDTSAVLVDKNNKLP